MFCHTGLSADPWKRLPYGLEGIAADCRGEIHVDPPILVHRLARPERIAEKRELDIGVISGPPAVCSCSEAPHRRHTGQTGCLADAA
jgi:hypothetical protein